MKVGFFDSGIGGTCILAAFKRLCPTVETVYLADSEHCPYGNRPPEEIRALADACVRKLLAQGCRMIVVACNTATAAAIDMLRERYPDVLFVGIEPAVKMAALHSKTGVVGVLATAGTFHSRLYNETKARFAQDVTVLAVVADEFVEIVERWKGGKVEECEVLDSVPMEEAFREHVERVVRAKIGSAMGSDPMDARPSRSSPPSCCGCLSRIAPPLCPSAGYCLRFGLPAS